MPEIIEEPEAEYEEGYERIKAEKGLPRREVLQRERISKAEAMQEIIRRHPNATIIFSNDYNTREAQANADRLTQEVSYIVTNSLQSTL